MSCLWTWLSIQKTAALFTPKRSQGLCTHWPFAAAMRQVNKLTSVRLVLAVSEGPGEKMDAMFGAGTSLAHQDTRTVTPASWPVWQLAVTVWCNDLSSCALGRVKHLGWERVSRVGEGVGGGRGVKGGGCGWGIQGGQMPAETVGGERVSLQPSGS